MWNQQYCNMKKITYTALLLFSALTMVFGVASCNDYETYADQKKKEKNAINSFITNNDVCGPITVISESQFCAQDSTTNLDKNEYVLFADDGIYMQVISKGEGKTIPEMSKTFADSTVNKVVLCRFTEYDIESGDTTLYNYGLPLWVDKLLVSYSHLSRSYTGSFTSGIMVESGISAVPSGWMKPLDYVRLSRDVEGAAKVRLIVPHTSGTSNANYSVLPYYYDITYQLGN